jgi:hypothetical protein
MVFCHNGLMTGRLNKLTRRRSKMRDFEGGVIIKARVATNGENNE